MNMADAVLTKGDYLRIEGLKLLIDAIRNDVGTRISRNGDTMEGPLTIKNIVAKDGELVIKVDDYAVYHVNRDSIYVETALGTETNVDLGKPDKRYDNVYTRKIHVASLGDIDLGDGQTLADIIDSLADAEEIWAEINKKADKEDVDQKFEDLEDKISDDIETKLDELDGKISDANTAIENLLDTIQEDLKKYVAKAGDTMEGPLKLNDIGAVGDSLVISTTWVDYVIDGTGIYARSKSPMALSGLGQESQPWEYVYAKNLKASNINIDGDASNVVFGDNTTLADKLNDKISNAEFASEKAIIDTKISNAKTEAIQTVKDDILGGASESYDTLKEIQQYLEDHADSLGELFEKLNLYILKSDYDQFVSDTNSKIDTFKGEVNSKVEGIKSDLETTKGYLEDNINDLSNNKVNRIGDDSISGSLTIGNELQAKTVSADNGKFITVEGVEKVQSQKVDFGNGIVFEKTTENDLALSVGGGRDFVFNKNGIMPQGQLQSLGAGNNKWYKVCTMYFETQDGKLAVTPDLGAPFTVNENRTLVDNLNADMLDGVHYSDIVDEINKSANGLKVIIDDFKKDYDFMIKDHEKRINSLEDFFRWKNFDELQERVGSLEENLEEHKKAVDEKFTELEGKINDDVDSVKSELNERIDNEVETLEGKITAEKDRAEAAEKDLEDKINSAKDDLEGTISSAVDDLDGKITAEKDRAEAAEKDLDDKITAEKDRAEAAEKDLDDKINSTKEELEGTINSTKEELEGTINSTKEELEGTISSAVEDLEGKITAEKDRAEAEESRLEGLINSNKSDLDDKLSDLKDELNDKIDSTKDDLESAINSTTEELEGKITAEKDRAEAEESRLEGLIEAEKDRAEAEESRLEGLIEAETTRATEAENALDGKIDSTKEDLEGTISSTKEELEGTISSTKEELEGTISSTKEELEGLIGSTKEELEGTINSAVEDLEGKITAEKDRAEAAEGVLDGKIDGVQSDLNDLRSTMENDYATKAEVAQAKSEAIESANGYTDDEIAKIRTDLGELEGNVSNIIEQELVTINNRIDSVENTTNQKFVEVNQSIEILGGKTSSLTKQFNEYKEEVTNMFNNADSNVDSKIQAAKDELNGNIDSAKETLEGEIGDLRQELEDHINSAKEELDDRFNNFDSDVDAKIQAAKDELNGNINSAKDELNGNINSAKTELTGKIEAEETARTEADNALDGKITAEKDRAEAEESRLEGLIGSTKEELEGTINSAVEDLEGTINSAVEDLEGKISAEETARTEADAALEGKINSNKTEIDGRLDDIESRLGNVSDEVAEGFVKKADFESWKSGELANQLTTTESNANKYTDAEVKKVNDKLADYCKHDECHASLEAAKTELKQYTDGKFNDAEKSISSVASDLDKFKDQTDTKFKDYVTKDYADLAYAKQSEFSDLKAQVALKVDATYVVEQLADKVSITNLNQTLADYAKTTDVNVKLSEKADKTDLEALRTRITNEESARQAADSAMQTDFSNQLTNLNNTVNSALTQHDKDIAAEKDARVAADTAEKEARVEGDNRLSGDITSEAGTRKEEDDKLRAMIEKCPTTETVNLLIQNEIQKIIGGGDSFTSITELIQYINEHGDVLEALQRQIAQKADLEWVKEQLALKANQSEVNSALATKVDKDTYTSDMNTKADKTDVQNQLDKKANDVDVQRDLALKADKTTVEIALANKADKDSIPTKTSQLINDGNGDSSGGFITINSDINGNAKTATMASDSERLGGIIASSYPQKNQPNTWTAYQDFQAGSGNSGSDMRYKVDVTPMDNVLDDVMKVDFIDYKWNKEGEPERETFGASAQQLQEIGGDFNKMVHFDTEGTRRVDYDRFGVIAMKAVQELYNIVLKQQEEIEYLKAKR